MFHTLVSLSLVFAELIVGVGVGVGVNRLAELIVGVGGCKLDGDDE
jgi:hypothetical protein